MLNPNLFRVALFICFVVVSFLVFSKPNYPQVEISHFDKIGHLGAFFALTLLTVHAQLTRKRFVVLLMMGYALLIEAVQSQLPYRSAEFADFIADMLGVLIYFVVAFIATKLFKPS